MRRFVNPDNTVFGTMLNYEIYVDKTELIEYTNSVLDTLNAYICNSRPRSFGKSYTANMLMAYYSKGADSEQIFSKLRIGTNADFETHLNKYDVIHIDMQWVLANCCDVDNIIQFITESVSGELKEIFSEKIMSEARSLPDCLSLIRAYTGHKFIIIIDEWDILIREVPTNLKIQEDYMRFLTGLFKVYSTGISNWSFADKKRKKTNRA